MRNNQRWQPKPEQSGPSELWGVVVADTGEVIIKPSTKLDSSDCQLICATHNAALGAGGEKALWCESLVNRKGEPIVQISLGVEMAQLTIRDARGHVAIMNETIEAAMSDAVIVRFMRQVLLQGDDSEEISQRTGQLLQMFRDFREELVKPPTIESTSES